MFFTENDFLAHKNEKVLEGDGNVSFSKEICFN